MPVDLRIEPDKARQLIVDVDEGMDGAIPEILDDLSEATRKSMTRQLFKQGSVATGTGYRSLQTVPRGSNMRDLKGRAYLVALDKGTMPHAPRDTFRLRFWASQEGWTVDGITQHIQRHGTEPHPFIEKSLDRSIVRFDSIALKHINKHTED